MERVGDLQFDGPDGTHASSYLRCTRYCPGGNVAHSLAPLLGVQRDHGHAALAAVQRSSASNRAALRTPLAHGARHQRHRGGSPALASPSTPRPESAPFSVGRAPGATSVSIRLMHRTDPVPFIRPPPPRSSERGRGRAPATPVWLRPPRLRPQLLSHHHLACFPTGGADREGLVLLASEPD